MDPTEPVTRFFAEQGVLGVIILLLLFVIGVLWRKAEALQKQVFDLQETRIKELQEMRRVAETSTQTLEALRIAATGKAA